MGQLVIKDREEYFCIRRPYLEPDLLTRGCVYKSVYCSDGCKIVANNGQSVYFSPVGAYELFVRCLPNDYASSELLKPEVGCKYACKENPFDKGYCKADSFTVGKIYECVEVDNYCYLVGDDGDCHRFEPNAMFKLFLKVECDEEVVSKHYALLNKTHMKEFRKNKNNRKRIDCVKTISGSIVPINAITRICPDVCDGSFFIYTVNDNSSMKISKETFEKLEDFLNIL